MLTLVEVIVPRFQELRITVPIAMSIGTITLFTPADRSMAHPYSTPFAGNPAASAHSFTVIGFLNSTKSLLSLSDAVRPSWTRPDGLVRNPGRYG